MHFRTMTALLLLAAGTLSAQQPEKLTVGKTIEKQLGDGVRHTYSLALDSGRFVIGEAMQKGIDLQVVLLGPRGDTIQKWDSPNGTEGPEPFRFTTKARGDYQLVIMPFETASGSGNYTLTLLRVEPEAKTPAGKVDQLMAAFRADEPGGEAAIVRGGNVVYSKAWGLANLTHKIPYTTETRTNIGSTSKQFTAFAILQLAAQNKLSLDDDVRKHVPELPDLGEKVTIRHLLTHTSGYREFLNALALAGRRVDFGDYIDRDEIIELLKRQPALQNKPGAEFNYNNSGFALLSTIVERVSGQTFPAYMRQHVFQPLGMNNTFIRATQGMIIPNSSQGYVQSAGGFREAQDIPGSMGAGGIYTTVGDLAKWVKNFKTGAVGAPGFFQAMTTRNVLTTGDTSAYGLGLFIDKWRGLPRVQHGGADIAHRSALWYFPTLDAAVIVDGNAASFNAEGFAAQLAEVFFADALPKTTPAPAAPVANVAFDPAKFDSLRFDAYAGRYELDEAPGFILSFTRRGSHYYTQATGQPEIEIFPTSDSTFALRVVTADVVFHRDATGKVNRLTLNQNGAHVARRVAETPEKVDLAQFTGRYFSEELEAYYDVVLDKDALVLRGRRTAPVRLTHQQGETFAGSFPVANVTFEKDASGKVTAFRAGNGRTRDVLFRKID